MIPGVQEQIVRRICRLAETDDVLQHELLEAARAAGGDVNAAGSLALADACEDLARRLHARLRATGPIPPAGPASTVPPGQYL
jgi:hypothetical protein